MWQPRSSRPNPDPPADDSHAPAAVPDGALAIWARQIENARQQTESSITDLAERFDMTLTGMRKHVGILEQAGLVTTEKVGRVRYCRVGERRLDEVAAWIETYHHLWDERFSELDKVIEQLKRKEKLDG